MASNDGQSLIADFRDRQRAGFIATTMDWLTTGVNIPCARNIVFFRYLRSPILFRQIVGRGTGKKPPSHAVACTLPPACVRPPSEKLRG